jgi:predicted amidohydrolase
MEWSNPDWVPPEGKAGTGQVRVASVQYEMRALGSFDEFAKQCDFFVDTAGEYGCDFVLFPELLTNQLLALVAEERPGASARRLTEFTEPYIQAFTSMAVKYNVNVVAGTHMTVENDRLYNIAYLFRRDGTMEKQYKLHVTPSEARWWGTSAGESMNVFDTDCGKIAILICYDTEFRSWHASRPPRARASSSYRSTPTCARAIYGFGTARTRAASRTTCSW